MFQRGKTITVILVAALLPCFAPAQDKAAKKSDDPLLSGLRYRLVGPFRGGRSATVTGVVGKPQLFYFGSVGGGVWRTTDGGSSWENISDGFFGGSIGAVAVSESDPNVIYVGGGEKTVRGNVSHGDGVWKSTDAGKTWKHIGLGDTRHIPRIRIHPKDPETVYAAALGHLYGPNKERGVFKSTDGGKNWKQVLFVNDEVGAVDLILDPNNPRIIYASTWRVKRTPYSLESGGPGSGLWKSVDSGDTWTPILQSAESGARSAEKKVKSGESSALRTPRSALGDGLPKGTVGIIGIAVSPVNSERVWAIVEAEDGGVFRSDNAGRTWTKINDDRNLRQRAWYYTRIYAHPKNVDEVFVVNVQFHKSSDGGKTFGTTLRTQHSDHHDLWIDPTEPTRMIVANDGGAQVSIDNGASWTTYHNQPTAQFYRVTTDNAFPYRIYGAQQDNSTVRIRSRGDGGGITERDWEPTAGGESGHIAVHPKDPDIVYGGSYGNFLIRMNHRTREVRNINVWPDNPLGAGAADLKYRFQWNFPIFFSPHDANMLYAAGNALFRTTDEGQSWTPISPDLTRNDKSKLGPSGGPITKDNTSVEYYCTIFAALESPHEKGVLWCGSDDGLLHLSRDDGKNWTRVTPPDLPEWSMINSLEAHPTDKGGLYLAVTRYKLDDFQPYLYKTTDYGKTWTKIVTGIKDDHFTRVVRADPKRPGLLYAGTESGMYISFDDGASWKRFQLNLPIVPITDLTIKNDDLIVATQGRSFWVLDDLTPLHQYKPEITSRPLHIFQPRPAYRLPGGRRGGGDDEGGRPSRTDGQNPTTGAVIAFHLKDAPPKETKSSLEILDANGVVVREYKSDAGPRGAKLDPKAGMNRIVWDLRHADAEDFPGMVIWGSLTGPRAVPGNYKARLKVGSLEESVEFAVKPDPRASASQSDYEEQLKFLLAVRDKLTETHRGIKTIRDVREQLTNVTKRLKDDSDIADAAKAIDKKLTAVEETLYQTKAKSSQDVLNFPIRLNNKLASVAGTAGMGDFRPTDQAEQVRKELTQQTDAELTRLRQVLSDDLPKFNELLSKKKVPGVFVDAKPPAK
jgi:photosystem II stability/assembly factor-like uncharacterized protein